MKLTDLPNELLDAIVELHLDDNLVRELRSLRLVCKRFAQQHAVLQHLFKHVQLVADPVDVAHFSPEALRNSSVAPFVQHVTFVPPLRYPMSFSAFKHIFQDQAYHRYGCYETKKVPNQHAEPSSWASITKTKLHTPAQYEAGYKEYDAKARVAQAFIEGEDIQEHWSQILSQLPCRSYRFALVDYNLIGLDLQPMRPACIIAGGRHSHQDLHIHCDEQKAETIADDFSAAVLKILCLLQIRTESLNCNQISMYTHTKVHVALNSATGPDLSRLQHFLLEPYPYHTDYTLIRLRDMLSEADIASICGKATETLETFQIRSRWPLAWGGQPVPMPRLRVLDLELIRFKASALAEWLPMLPALEYISLRSMELHIEDEDDEEEEDDDVPSPYMKRMFDAMRNHKTLRRGTLGFQDTLEDIEHRFSFHKDGKLRHNDEVSLVSSMLEGGISFDHVDAWLELYICGRIEWTGALKVLWGRQVGDGSDDA